MNPWTFVKDGNYVELDNEIIVVNLKGFAKKFPGFNRDFLKAPRDDYSDVGYIIHSEGWAFSIYAHGKNVRIRRCGLRFGDVHFMDGHTKLQELKEFLEV